MEDSAMVEIVVVVVVVTETKKEEEELNIMFSSTTPATVPSPPSHNIIVNIERVKEEVDYFRKNIIWMFKSTCMWFVVYVVVYNFASLLVISNKRHRHRVLIFTIVFSLVFFLLECVLITKTSRYIKSYLQAVDSAAAALPSITSMKDQVHIFLVALYLCSSAFTLFYLGVTAHLLPSEWERMNLCLCFGVVLVVLLIHLLWSECMIDKDFEEFYKRILQSRRLIKQTSQQQQQQSDQRPITS